MEHAKHAIRSNNRYGRHDSIIGEDLRKIHGAQNCPVISSPEVLANIFSEAGKLDQQILIAGTLDRKCRMIFCAVLAVGLEDRVKLRIGDIFQMAIRMGGSSVFLVQNHPFGPVQPSRTDFKLTQQTAEAGLLLGYPLVDHVIVGLNEYTSLLSGEVLPHWSKYQIARLFPAKSADGATIENLESWHCHRCRHINITQHQRALGMEDAACFVCMAARCHRCNAFAWLLNTANKGIQRRARRSK